MKTVTPLQRGRACLCCRKRKMKCDGLRPVCTQCLKSNRGTECQYHEKQHISRTQLLQQKVSKLEARLRELESEQAEESTAAAASSSTDTQPAASEDDQQYADLPLSSGAATATSEWDLNLVCFHPSSSSGSAIGSSSTSSTSIPPDLLPTDVSWTDDTFPLPTFDLPIPGLSPEISSLTEPVNWWEDGTTFCENKQRLLELFFSHRHQCAFDVHLGRLQASLQMASSLRPHPALMDAVYLLACFFSRLPHLMELEPYFLKRCLQGISEALHQQDRVVHVLQASCLIAVYFYCQGRILEAYYHSSTSARLAIDLGLHQIRPMDFEIMLQSLAGDFRSSGSPSAAIFPLPYPSDAIEHAERVAAFWQIFIVDRAWSVATGLPSALPDDNHPRTQIETSWPMSISDIWMTSDSVPLHMYDSGLVGNTLASSTVTLRAKAVMLFERTARFSISTSHSETDWVERRSLEMSLAQFAANLPGINKRVNQLSPSAEDVDLINIHTLIYTATIHLYKHEIETQRASYEKCLVSAKSVTAIVRNLDDSDYGFLDPITSTCWRCVADVYLRTLMAGKCDAVAINQDLDTLLDACRRLAFFFPVAGVHASSIEKQPMNVHVI